MISGALTRGLAILLLLAALASPAVCGETVELVVDREIGPPARYGLKSLEEALAKRGFAVERAKGLSDGNRPVFVVGLTGASPVVDATLAANHWTVGKKAESLLVKRLPGRARPTVVLAGRDDRGLMYALLDVARWIELALDGSEALGEIHEADESPDLDHRAVSIHLFNADLDRPWYYDEEFWHAYFGMLARSRLNVFSLTFADHTAYLNPPYPFLVEVPEYPQVKAIGLSDADRQRNLTMLRRISDLADEHGIDFVLSVWMQGPMLLKELGCPMVKGLPEYPKDYAAKALGRILAACPAIRGVQFRANLESGIPEDKQTDYFGALFRAMRDCGRRMTVDLRFKGIRPTTITAAKEAGLDVNVSTKHWCEQMGLPFHPTVEDMHNRESRYGYSDMLRYPRAYKVTFRLWTVGTQKILLFGDPEFGARFARSCRLGGAHGFEVFAPLSNKGFGNSPGSWRIFADRSFDPYRFEQQRYWMFYLTFGRTGYRADVEPYVWRQELRGRFGKAAGAVETAYRESGKILTLLTAARLNSASEWRTWPEMEPGYPLGAYARIIPSDTSQFYPIRTFARVPGYRSEGWAGGIPGYVEDVLQRKLRAQWTPFDVSRRLLELSRRTLAAADEARRLVPDTSNAEFKSTDLDMRILANLALYHAEKTAAATHVELFKETKQTGRLPVALKHINTAVAAWETIVKLTDGVYCPDMVFGANLPDLLKPPFDLTAKTTHHLCGDWKDRLELVRYDQRCVEELVRKHQAQPADFPRFPGEEALDNPPTVDHRPIHSAAPGKDLVIAARVTSGRALARVVLHHRPVNQMADWQQVDMKPKGDGHYEASIPGDAISPTWDYMYYIEALVEGGGGTLWPSWEDGPPYVVVELDRAS